MFYTYAQAEGKFGKDVESQVEVADMTVYLLLFYLSEKHDFHYSFHTSIKELTEILETNEEVVQRALKSLSNHHLIHYHNHENHIHITIEPITIVNN